MDWDGTAFVRTGTILWALPRTMRTAAQSKRTMVMAEAITIPKKFGPLGQFLSTGDVGRVIRCRMRMEAWRGVQAAAAAAGGGLPLRLCGDGSGGRSRAGLWLRAAT